MPIFDFLSGQFQIGQRATASGECSDERIGQLVDPVLRITGVPHAICGIRMQPTVRRLFCIAAPNLSFDLLFPKGGFVGHDYLAKKKGCHRSPETA